MARRIQQGIQGACGTGSAQGTENCWCAYSGPTRQAIPVECDTPFRLNAAPYSGECDTPSTGQGNRIKILSSYWL